MKYIETVKKDCKHKDCVYRMLLDTSTPFCNYAVIEHELRGCPISQCTRYKRGIRSVTIDRHTMYAVWSIEEIE